MKLWLSFVSCLGFPEDAVLISCGFQATHILPVVGGAVDHAHCKRLNVGGSHLVTYMQHLVQLQVPSLRQYIYHSRAEVSRKGRRERWGGREGGGEGSRKGGRGRGRARDAGAPLNLHCLGWRKRPVYVFLLPTPNQELTLHHCYMAGNFADELQHWAQGQQDHLTRRIQLPFHQVSSYHTLTPCLGCPTSSPSSSVQSVPFSFSVGLVFSYPQCGLVQESAPDPKKAALQAERRRKAGERLRELNKKRKLEKVGPSGGAGCCAWMWVQVYHHPYQCCH